MEGLDFNLTDYIKFFLAFIFVLSLIGLATVAARRLGFGLPNSPGKSDQRRLGIVETLNVDGKRRLVLIRRDDTEHLLLLGVATELLVESAITPPENAFTKALNDAHKATQPTAKPQGPPLPKALSVDDGGGEKKS